MCVGLSGAATSSPRTFSASALAGERGGDEKKDVNAEYAGPIRAATSSPQTDLASTPEGVKMDGVVSTEGQGVGLTQGGPPEVRKPGVKPRVTGVVSAHSLPCVQRLKYPTPAQMGTL